MKTTKIYVLVHQTTAMVTTTYIHIETTEKKNQRTVNKTNMKITIVKINRENP